MQLISERKFAGPKTHAFVIGVGDYPYAKRNQGVQENLRKVPNLPSAADSAKLFCDWLIDHQDQLAAPLSTLEVLISDPDLPNNRYPWRNAPPGSIERATADNVAASGKAWFKRVAAEPGNIALLYCCGHGASHGQQQPVLFLEDLNQNEENVWTHIDLWRIAQALRKDQTTAAAFMIADTCGEYIPDFELGDAQDTRFSPKVTAPSRNHVALLCAASERMLAYEGEDAPGSSLKFGRLTQTLLKALDGSSARWFPKGWGVTCKDLMFDLKSLRHVYFSHWSNDKPFEPYPVFTPTDPLPIVYADKFELPLVVMTFPTDRMPEYAFVISQRDVPDPPWLRNRAAGDAKAWFTTVPPGLRGIYAIAIKGANHYPLQLLPRQPMFDQWVPVP